MDLFVIVLLLFTRYASTSGYLDEKYCNCRAFYETSDRITNGTTADKSTLQFVALIIGHNDKKDEPQLTELGSGTVVSSKYVMTTANTYMQAKERNLLERTYAGAGGDMTIETLSYNKNNNKHIKTWIPHPGFTANRNQYLLNNIALAKLETPFELGEKYNIYAACLLSVDVTKLDRDYQNFVFAGYGVTEKFKRKPTLNESHPEEIDFDTENNQLRWIQLERIDCLEGAMFGPRDNLICLGSQTQGICLGDAGGPLLYRNDDKFYTVGLFSMNYKQGEFDCVPDRINIFTILTEPIYHFLDQYLGHDICEVPHIPYAK